MEDPLTADWQILFLRCIHQGLQSTNKHARFPAKFSSLGTWRRSLWTVRFRSSRPYGSAGKAGLQRDRLMRQLARCDASLCGLLAVEVHCCLLEGLLAFCSRFSQFLVFNQVYFRFLMSFGLAACTKMFSTWDFRSAGAFPAFLLTELASVPAWQFAAGHAQLHGFALFDGTETARRCVKHSLLERPGPKGLSPLQA